MVVLREGFREREGGVRGRVQREGGFSGREGSMRGRVQCNERFVRGYLGVKKAQYGEVSLNGEVPSLYKKKTLVGKKLNNGRM